MKERYTPGDCGAHSFLARGIRSSYALETELVKQMVTTVRFLYTRDSLFLGDWQEIEGSPAAILVRRFCGGLEGRPADYLMTASFTRGRIQDL